MTHTKPTRCKLALPGGYKAHVFTQPGREPPYKLVVYDKKWQVVGSENPYPDGWPHQAFRRKQLELETARKIIDKE
jgi:hypothetical protein